MKSQFLRVGGSFALVVSTYWLYTLIAVPLIEPQTTEVSAASQRGARDPAPRPGNRHAELFSRLFPEGAWETKNAKVFEYGNAMLLAADYSTMENGDLKLTPCTMVFLPKGATDLTTKVDRAVILEAPEGAEVFFNEPLDLGNLQRAGSNRPVGGRFRGEITIRNASTRADDEALRVVTRNVQLSEDRIWTDDRVDFQYGESHGSGREMEIRLLVADNPSGAKRRDGKIDGLRSFSLADDVEFRLQPKKDGSSTGVFGSGGNLKGGTSVVDEPEPPITVTCEGKFYFDLIRNVASFHDRVNVVRHLPEGPSDKLLCELLELHFRRSNDADRSGKQDLSGLEVDHAVALGNPVRLEAPSEDVSARGERLTYFVETKKVVLEHAQSATFIRGKSVIEVPYLEYEPGPDKTLGKLLARGAGRLEAAQKDDPEHPIRVQWSKELAMRPDKGLHVISVMGDAQVSMPSMFALRADTLHLWVTQAPDEQTEISDSSASSEDNPFKNIRPRSLYAEGQQIGDVSLWSEELTAKVQELRLWFKQAEPGAGVANADPFEPAERFSSRNSPATESSSNRDRYELQGQRLNARMLQTGKAMELTDVSVEGQAYFAQIDPKGQDRPALIAKGDALQVERANTLETLVRVVGDPGVIETPDLVLEGPRIELDRGKNLLAVNQAGSLQMEIKEDLDGKPLAEPERMQVDWQGSMTFDGLTATFDRGIYAHSDRRWLRTEKMRVTINRRIDFSSSDLSVYKKPGAVELEQVKCTGGVTLASTTHDEKGRLSFDRLEGKTLSLNQRSGNFHILGPGTVDSVRRGERKLGPEGDSAGPPATVGAEDERPKLTFSRVEFAKEIKGNIHEKEVKLSDRISSISGPVETWEQTIALEAGERLDDGQMTLECDRLILRDMSPGNKFRDEHLEVVAQIDAIAEGRVGDLVYTARGHQIVYIAAKEKVSLEGDGRNKATLYRQSPGQSPIRSRFQKMHYWPKTNRITLEGGTEIGGGIRGTAPRTPERR